MSTESEVPSEIREAAARLTHVLIDDIGDAIVNSFVEVCRGLPWPRSACDLVSAMEPSVCRRLESIMMRSFQQKLRPRSDRAVPRPITEIRAASKAWNLSPLVLLVEFTDAPVSDNFWRLLSQLARRSDDWLTTRNLLHDARSRRQLDPLARRKGVSRTQAWAIPDLEAAIQLQKDDPPSVTPEMQDKEHGDSHEIPGATEDVWLPETSVQPGVWRLLYGWWLSPDIVHRLCTSLVWLQPTFCAIDPRAVHSANPVDLGIHPPTADTIAVPHLVDQFNRWELNLFSRTERIISLYQAAPSDQSDELTVMERILSSLLPDESFDNWTIVLRSCPSEQSGADSSVAVVVFLLYCLVGRAMPTSLDIWLWRRMLACYLSQASIGGPPSSKEIGMVAEMATSHAALYDPAKSLFDVNPLESNPSIVTATQDRTVTATTAAKRQADTGQVDAVTRAAQKRLAALRSNAAEAKALWLNVADIATKVEADARTDLDGHVQKLQSIRKRLDILRERTKRRPGADEARMSHEENVLSLSVPRLENCLQTSGVQISEFAVKRRAIDAVLKDIHELSDWVARNTSSTVG